MLWSFMVQKVRAFVYIFDELIKKNIPVKFVKEVRSQENKDGAHVGYLRCSICSQNNKVKKVPTFCIAENTEPQFPKVDERIKRLCLR